MNIDSSEIFRVVMNDEEQYSIWPDYKQIPDGWHDAGKVGPKEDCLVFVNENWTDMRPLSLRIAMAADAQEHNPSGGT